MDSSLTVLNCEIAKTELILKLERNQNLINKEYYETLLAQIIKNGQDIDDIYKSRIAQSESRTAFLMQQLNSRFNST